MSNSINNSRFSLHHSWLAGLILLLMVDQWLGEHWHAPADTTDAACAACLYGDPPAAAPALPLSARQLPADRAFPRAEARHASTAPSVLRIRGPPHRNAPSPGGSTGAPA